MVFVETTRCSYNQEISKWASVVSGRAILTGCATLVAMMEAMAVFSMNIYASGIISAKSLGINEQKSDTYNIVVDLDVHDPPLDNVPRLAIRDLARPPPITNITQVAPGISRIIRDDLIEIGKIICVVCSNEEDD